ncbi:MAG: VIT and VWA domain-containing protein [Planctomycetes bacterium]|nr:VIT and VWA domain-containing protein [Planctomycetota bacterium]
MKTYAYLTIAALAVAFSGAAFAQGIAIDRRIRPIPMPRPAPIRIQNIEIRTHSVETTIDGQSATTTISQTFYNPNTRQLEGTYMFPLPAEAAIDNFEMTMNGKMVKGELLPAAKAKKIYVDTVRRMIDPGLLEYAGRGLFKASVFPILPQKELKIKFTYTELLPYDSGLVRFSYPLRTKAFCQAAPQNVAVKVNLKSDSGLRTIYSPTHKVEVIRKGENEATIGFELKNKQPGNDFELYWGYGDKALAANVLSFKEGKNAGYFLALLTPKVKLTKDEIMPKDVIIVMDTSGSMLDDGKMAQARKAMKFIVNKLNDKDKFAVVTFSTEARKWHDSLVDATEEARKATLKKIEALTATGGTNMEGAIRMAYDLAAAGDAKRPCYVLFLTDGLPTMGEVTDVRALAKIAKEKRNERVRIFPFGVGHDVNTWLLDTLAEQNKGQREYVKPGEDIELKVSNFANKIASPVLSDVTLKINGAEIHDLHPQIPGDVFAGTQLSVLGRFDKPGKHTLLLEGTVNGEKQAFEYTIDLAAGNTDKAYLPRMWGVRRVGFLMDQIKQKGVNDELKKEIVRLGVQFGIVTPYTSFLIIEDTPPPAPGAPRPSDSSDDGSWFEGRGGRKGKSAAGGGAGSRAAGPKTGEAEPSEQMGEEAVEDSKSNSKRRENSNADEADDAEEKEVERLSRALKKHGAKTRSDKRRKQLEKQGYSKKEAEQAAKEVIKTIGERSFIWSEGIWLESDLTNGELFGATGIEYLSEAYLELLDNKTTAKVLALGDKVIFRHNGKTYRITVKSAEIEEAPKDETERNG